MEDQVTKVESYKCRWCGELYGRESDACDCAFKHAQQRLATVLLRNGNTLSYINWKCGFGWTLKDDQKDITQDNCFIFSHWQCCDKPAYRIVEIESGGWLRLFGHGSWMGGYGGIVSPDKLPNAHPKEELYEHKKEQR